MTKDAPLTRQELAELHRLRIGKPKSQALPQNAYQSAERFTQYERERAEAKRRKDENRVRAARKK